MCQQAIFAVRMFDKISPQFRMWLMVGVPHGSGIGGIEQN
jgi:hypothetical protein